MINKNNTIINFALLTVIVFLLFPNITLANKTLSEIGDTCVHNLDNSDCDYGGAGLDCEESSLPGNPMYCTCNNSGDCLSKYGQDAPFTPTWYCWNDNQDKTNLKYCHNDSGYNIFPDKGIPKAFSQPYYLSKKPDGTYECLIVKNASDQPQFAGLPLCEPEASKLNDALSPSVGLPGEAGKKTTDSGETPPPAIVVVETVTEEEKKLKITKPTLAINIPQLNFSDVENSIDSEGFLHLPYIGEYISAIYKVLMIVVSIIGVIMIIVVGVKITVLGGQERIEGFKKIGQIVIGLFIAWGSYSILHTINPALVNFDVLKVKYIEKEPSFSFGNVNTDPHEEGGGSAAPFPSKFTDCPVKLDSPVIYKKDSTTLPGYIESNSPRRKEFAQKILSQNIITGTISERIVQTADAAKKCQIHHQNCGAGSTAVVAIAAVNGSKGLDNPCLTRHCGLGEKVNTVESETVHSVLNKKIEGYGIVRSFLRGMWCGSIPECTAYKLKLKWPGGPGACIKDKAEAKKKLRDLLTTTGKWSPDWIKDLRPGDSYVIVNFNPSCDGAHSALFLGWADEAKKIAYVTSGSSQTFITITTRDLNNATFLSISRPIEYK